MGSKETAVSDLTTVMEYIGNSLSTGDATFTAAVSQILPTIQENDRNSHAENPDMQVTASHKL